MDTLKKALQDLAEAIETEETVAKVTVTITFKKPPKPQGKDDK